MSYQHSKCSDMLNYKHITEMVESNIQDRNIGWGFSRFVLYCLCQYGKCAGGMKKKPDVFI